MDKVNLTDKLSLISEHWQPRVVGELNGQHVRLAKLQGEFIWHRHEQEDELFLVLCGSLEMRFRDRSLRIEEGEFLIVPRGTSLSPGP